MLVLLTATVLAAAGALQAMASPPALVYDVAAAKGADAYHVTFTITNKGNTTTKLLADPRGALSTLPTDAFQITHDESGKSPDFQGAYVKYVPTVAAKIGEDDAFTVIKPGESFTVTHDLSKAYDFASSGTGAYTVEPSSSFYYIDESGAPAEVKAPAQKVHITVTSAPAPRSVDASLHARATFPGCSATRRSAVIGAINPARSYAYYAYYKLAGNSRRYVTWFGTYTNARRITVRNHYARIYNTGFAGFAYDCTCTDSGTYAYVYANQPTKIYFCGAYWSAPTTGTDSKAGTMVHESSHFLIHGGTKDYAYGQTNAQALARSYPDRAVFNADSHEYFAENNPNIPKEEADGAGFPSTLTLEDENV